MATYIFDSNIITYLEDFNSAFHDKLVNKIASTIGQNDKLCLSILILYEYEFSIAAANDDIAEGLRKTRNTLLETFEILPLTLEGAGCFGKIKKAYQTAMGIQKKALIRHNVDLMIASTAIVENAVLISNDKIFEAIREIEPDFQFENWIK